MSAKALETMSKQRENAAIRKAEKAAARAAERISESARKRDEYLADCRVYFYVCAGWLILLIFVLLLTFNNAMSAYAT